MHQNTHSFPDEDSEETHQALKTRDAVLLERYVQHKCTESFRGLMEKHKSLVLGVAQQVLVEKHDVEDVFQAVFVKFARKAHTIKYANAISSWLYRVAYREALLVQKQNCKTPVANVTESSLVDHQSSLLAEQNEQLELLHKELRLLPQKYRLPLILCSLEGFTRKEAAHELDTIESAVQALLNRGRHLLKKRLAKRGVSLGAVLTAWHATQAKAAVYSTGMLLDQTVELCLAHQISTPTLVKVALVYQNKILVLGFILFLCVGVTFSVFWLEENENPESPDVAENRHDQELVTQVEETPGWIQERVYKHNSYFRMVKPVGVFDREPPVPTLKVNSSEITITDEMWEQLAKEKTIQGVAIDGHVNTDVAFRSLKSKPELRMLQIANNPIKEEAIKQISELSNLDELSLTTYHFSDESFLQLSTLKKLRGLTLRAAGPSPGFLQ